MRKDLSTILKEVEELSTSFNKQAEDPNQLPIAGNQMVPEAQVPQAVPQQSVVPQGSPEEQAIMAEQAQMAQAEANANMVNAAIAAEKKKEDAITNAAATLVSAEQSKEEALNTLNQVAAEALANENAIIAKEASDFGAIAGASMADSFYNNMYTNNIINEHYKNAYDSVNAFMKTANISNEAYELVDNFIKTASISKEAYDLVDASLQIRALAANAYNEVSNIL